MFDSFHGAEDATAKRRYLASTTASAAVYGAILLGLGLAATQADAIKEAAPIEVRFRPPPPVIEPPPPPPAAPPSVPVKQPSGRRAPVAVPKEMPAEAPAESELEKPLEGSGTPELGAPAVGAAPPPPPPPPAPPAPPKKEAKVPVNLPENATAPVADSANAPPEYPAEMREKGVEAKVILKIVVSENGLVTKVEVLRGEEPFVSAAIAAVKTWRYSPALVGGAPTPVFRIVQLPFRLK